MRNTLIAHGEPTGSVDRAQRSRAGGLVVGLVEGHVARLDDVLAAKVAGPGHDGPSGEHARVDEHRLDARQPAAVVAVDQVVIRVLTIDGVAHGVEVGARQPC